MLTQKAARTFFVAGTVLFGGIFLGLTVDTIQKTPQLTNAQNLTPAVIAGKHIWEEKNCMGCHTLLGEGAYYAPELTKVMERRNAAFVRQFLKDPEAMFPGARRMPNYNFSDEEITNVIAFLDWVGKVDSQGFPPKPRLAQAQAATMATTGRPAVFDQSCLACHSFGGFGGNVGPHLDGIGSRRDQQWLETWLADPSKVKPDSKMPNLQLPQADIKALAQFLAAQK